MGHMLKWCKNGKSAGKKREEVENSGFLMKKLSFCWINKWSMNIRVGREGWWAPLPGLLCRSCWSPVNVQHFFSSLRKWNQTNETRVRFPTDDWGLVLEHATRSFTSSPSRERSASVGSSLSLLWDHSCWSELMTEPLCPRPAWLFPKRSSYLGKNTFH